MKLVLFASATLLALGIGAAQSQTNSGNQFEFRSPYRATYQLVDAGAPQRALAGSKEQWLTARRGGNTTNTVEFGSRVVLQLEEAEDLQKLIAGRALELARTVQSNVFILQAPDALTAMREANGLAAAKGVKACYPILRRHNTLAGPYAPRPNDPFAIPYFISSGSGQIYDAEWPIENRDGFSTRIGLDMNVMAAWPYGKGQGITVAVADSGLEMNHPELTNRLAGAPHYNFVTQSTNNAGPTGGNPGDPFMTVWIHGTAVGGLIAAEGDNGRGMVGVAPEAKLASWLIYTIVTNTTTGGFVDALVPDDRLMEMYQYASNIVSVQNHSWGAGNRQRILDGPSLLEQIGIENAVTLGRNGRGVVMVRAAGNDRGDYDPFPDATEDGYPNSPYVIAVGAVTKGGKRTSFGEPGSCLLVAAPGGGDNSQGLFTLDLVGTRGLTTVYAGDLNDYNFGVQGFIGTSGSAPLVSGVVADVLSVNTNLSYRDVQQIMLLSARHWDFTDPDIVTNAAGLVVSHNVGFGVPNAGYAVQMARTWSNRPPLVTLTMVDTQSASILDQGLRVEVTGSEIPGSLASILSLPTQTPGLDGSTLALPLVDVGTAASVPAVNLTNKGALILRDARPFVLKILNAAKAGAAFAIIYNSPNGGAFTNGVTDSGTANSPIPTVFIGNSGGETLKAVLQTNSSALARIHLLSTDKTFHVNSTLLCEQVGVRIQTDHPLRGDVRITVRSPQGTRSVLQHINNDTNSGPADWTYWSTHHFFESSAGDWTVSVSDELPGSTGNVLGVSLIIRGTQINDSDHDGLDDGWETTNFGSLSYGPKDDPDNDGINNMREQLTGTNPMVSDLLKTPDLSRWGLFGSDMVRVSWPSAPQYSYKLFGGTNISSLNLISNVPGVFPEAEAFVPYSPTNNGFFKVQAFQ